MRSLRERANPKLTATELARRVNDLGYPYSRNALVNLEGGRKNSVDVSELIAIAYVLQVPPVLLIYPNIPSGTVEAIPGRTVKSGDALFWFTGEDYTLEHRERPLEEVEEDAASLTAPPPVELLRRYYWHLESLQKDRNAFDKAVADHNKELADYWQEEIKEIEWGLNLIRQRMTEAGMPYDEEDQ